MLTKKEFDNIVLSKKELKMLKSLSNRKRRIFDGHEYRQLLSNNLVTRNVFAYDEDGLPVSDGSYLITEKGLRYLEFHKNKWFNKFFSDLRGWITTLIAVAAFILSVISLIKQSGK